MPVRKNVYKIPIEFYHMIFMRQCYVNEIDYFYEFFIIYAIKNNEETPEELEQFAACASSLNGFQPKINIYDNERNLCIAKLSSIFKNDFNEMKREILAYKLAQKSGLNLQEYSIETTKNGERYLLLKRFDRIKNTRIPFIYFSDVCNTHSIYNYDDKITDAIKSICSKNSKENLKEIFKRKLFRIMIGNVRDMFPNTAFLFNTKTGWNLSPDFDINCGYYKLSDKEELLNKKKRNSEFRIKMAQELINNSNLYEVSKKEIEEIIKDFKKGFKDWQQEAINIGFKDSQLLKLKICEEVVYNLLV